MLIRHIERFLRSTQMAATRFGRLAANDPRFVFDLRNGRSPRAATASRTLEFIQSYKD